MDVGDCGVGFGWSVLIFCSIKVRNPKPETRKKTCTRGSKSLSVEHIRDPFPEPQILNPRQVLGEYVLINIFIGMCMDTFVKAELGKSCASIDRRMRIHKRDSLAHGHLFRSRTGKSRASMNRRMHP